MTRLPAQSAAPEAGRRRIMALHRQGSQWRLVVLERNGAVSVAEARTVPFSDADAVRSAAERWGVSEVLRIAPSSACIARLAALPAGENAEQAAAAALLAEAELPQTLPPHRRAWGLTRWSPAPGQTSALLIGWPGERDEPDIPGLDSKWTAEPAALAALVGDRRDALAWHADRSAGSFGVVALGAAGAVVRCAREAAPNDAEWSALAESSARRAASRAETDTGAPPRRIDQGPVVFGADEATLRALLSIPGTRDEASWLAAYAVALGAARGTLEAGPHRAALYAMRADPPRQSRSFAMTLASRLAEPRRAIRVIAASVLIALGAWLVAPALRAAVLSARGGDLSTQQAQDEDHARRAAFVAELERRRWPMTKIMADLVRAMPVGAQAETLRIEQAQRLSLRGTAPSLDAVNRFQAGLAQSGVFEDVSIDRTQQSERTRGVIEFDLSARVARPFNEPRDLDDFASLTLAQRLYGEGAAAPAPLADAAQPDTRRTETQRGRAATDSVAPERARADRAAADIPAPISAEEIARLDSTSAMREWAGRHRAARQPGLDAETKARLDSEAALARERMSQARREEGGS